MKIVIIYDYPDVTRSIDDAIDAIENSGLI